MGIAVGRGRLGVAQQLSDHRQSLAQPGGDTGKGVPEIVKPDVIETCLSPNMTPRLLRIHQVGAAPLADDASNQIDPTDPVTRGTKTTPRNLPVKPKENRASQLVE